MPPRRRLGGQRTQRRSAPACCPHPPQAGRQSGGRQAGGGQGGRGTRGAPGGARRRRTAVCREGWAGGPAGRHMYLSGQGLRPPTPPPALAAAARARGMRGGSSQRGAKGHRGRPARPPQRAAGESYKNEGAAAAEHTCGDMRGNKNQGGRVGRRRRERRRGSVSVYWFGCNRLNRSAVQRRLQWLLGTAAKAVGHSRRPGSAQASLRA